MAIGVWYRLDANRKPVACKNHSEYFEWHRLLPKESATGIGIQLARTRISDRLSVSTVFLGTDHAYDMGPPELWETMIFVGDRDEETTRYRSWDDAIAGHERIVNELSGVVASEDAKQPSDSGSVASHCYAAVDLVITKDCDGRYHATGGPSEAIFGGNGISSDEAIGSWFRQNRESVNFKVSFVMDGKFQASTRYGVGRSKEELGPNELKALKELERHKSA